MRSRKTALAAVLLCMVSGTARAQTGSPAGPVPVAELQQRRERLLDRIGDGVAVIEAAHVLDMEGEAHPQDSDFRQSDDFFYLTGLETPDSWLVLIASTTGPDQVRLYIPPRNPEEEQWTGARLDAAAAARESGITDVRSTERISEVNALGKPLALEQLRAHTYALRLIKDADELRRLRRAIDITTGALVAAMKQARPGLFEYELEATIEYEFRRAGAERVGFPSIVGSAENSTTLHYDKNRRRTEDGDVVVMDVGAEFGYYTADVTRTIPVNGRFSERQRALYNLVLGAQDAAIKAVRPGLTLPQLDAIARDYMRKNSGRLCGAQTCDAFFAHGIGHWLGMNVHDPSDMGMPFAPGAVLTVEPGIYLPAERIGIRIEDDVLVTANGYELLSGGAPRRAEDIETLMMQQR